MAGSATDTLFSGHAHGERPPWETERTEEVDSYRLEIEEGHIESPSWAERDIATASDRWPQRANVAVTSVDTTEAMDVESCKPHLTSTIYLPDPKSGQGDPGGTPSQQLPHAREPLPDNLFHCKVATVRSTNL